MVNFDYAGNVNRQREREGKAEDFTAQANWFEHVSKAVVAHRITRELYAYVRVQSNLTPPFFTVDGAEVARAVVVPFLPSDDLTDDERRDVGLGADLGAPKQNLVAEIQPIAIKLGNVRELTTCGTVYTLTPEPITLSPEPITATTSAGAVVH